MSDNRLKDEIRNGFHKKVRGCPYLGLNKGESFEIV